MPQLRENLDEMLDRVEAGETIRVTRDGRPVAELRPLADDGRWLTTAEIIELRRKLPSTDLDEFRRDLDAIVDPYA